MKKALKLLGLLMVMIMIFMLSSQPKVETINTTNGFIQIVYEVYAFIFGKYAIGIDRFCELYFQPIRKLAHFSEFALLGLLAYLNVEEYFKKRLVSYSLLISVIYAISDEVHQYFVEGRYCTLKDMCIDSAGALCAILFMHLINKKCLKK